MSNSAKRRSKKEVIKATWDRFERTSAGAAELAEIQKELKLTFGTIDSPASVARFLADEGIALRHPEVLRFDAEWRERRLYELFGPGELDFETLSSALESLKRIDELGIQFETEADEEGQKALAELVRELKADLPANEFAREVGQWLTVWLQNPVIFADWLSLRIASPEFKEKFQPDKH